MYVSHMDDPYDKLIEAENVLFEAQKQYLKDTGWILSHTDHERDGELMWRSPYDPVATYNHSYAMKIQRAKDTSAI